MCIRAFDTYVIFKNPFGAIFGRFFEHFLKCIELPPSLLEDEGRDGDWEVFGKAKKFYKSCMNLERLEELGVGPVLDTLKRLGNWPVLEGDKWSGKGYHWWDQGGNPIAYTSFG